MNVVSDHWTEVLRCPNCALTGVAVLSLPNGSDSVRLETLPAGFRAVTSKYGDTFYCVTCDRPASEVLGDRRRQRAALILLNG